MYVEMQRKGLAVDYFGTRTTRWSRDDSTRLVRLKTLPLTAPPHFRGGEPRRDVGDGGSGGARWRFAWTTGDTEGNGWGRCSPRRTMKLDAGPICALPHSVAVTVGPITY